MADPTASSFDRSQRRQLALIPVLGLVLAAVLFWPESDPRTPSAAIGESETNSNRRQMLDKPTAAETTRPATRTWPRIPLAEILSFDPFALPSGLNNPQSSDHDKDSERDPAKERLARQADELQGRERTSQLRESLQRQRVSAIFYSDTGAAAVIDSQVVRQGDLLSEGVRVLEIGPQGVVVRIENDP